MKPFLCVALLATMTSPAFAEQTATLGADASDLAGGLWGALSSSFESNCPKGQDEGLRQDRFYGGSCPADSLLLSLPGRELARAIHPPFDVVEEWAWIQEALRQRVGALQANADSLDRFSAHLGRFPDAPPASVLRLPEDRALENQVTHVSENLALICAAEEQLPPPNSVDVSQMTERRLVCQRNADPDQQSQCLEAWSAKYGQLQQKIDALHALKDTLLNDTPILALEPFGGWIRRARAHEKQSFDGRSFRSDLAVAIGHAKASAASDLAAKQALLDEEKSTARRAVDPQRSLAERSDALARYDALMHDGAPNRLLDELLLTTDPTRTRGLEHLSYAACRLENRSLHGQAAAALRSLALNVGLTVASMGAGAYLAAAQEGATTLRGMALAQRALPVLAVNVAAPAAAMVSGILETQKECDALIRGIGARSARPGSAHQPEALGSSYLACRQRLFGQIVAALASTAGSAFQSSQSVREALESRVATAAAAATESAQGRLSLAEETAASGAGTTGNRAAVQARQRQLGFAQPETAPPMRGSVREGNWATLSDLHAGAASELTVTGDAISLRAGGDPSSQAALERFRRILVSGETAKVKGGLTFGGLLSEAAVRLENGTLHVDLARVPGYFRPELEEAFRLFKSGDTKALADKLSGLNDLAQLGPDFLAQVAEAEKLTTDAGRVRGFVDKGRSFSSRAKNANLKDAGRVLYGNADGSMLAAKTMKVDGAGARYLETEIIYKDASGEARFAVLKTFENGETGLEAGYRETQAACMICHNVSGGVITTQRNGIHLPFDDHTALHIQSAAPAWYRP